MNSVRPSKRTPAIRFTRRTRLLVLLALLLLLFALGNYYNLGDRFDPVSLRSYIQGMGVLGVLVYVALFSLLLLVSVPGIIFMIAAGLIWGNVQGVLVALLGANLAVCFSFALVRRFQGEGFEAEQVNNPMLRRVLAGIERSPVKTVAVMRCLISTAPALNYGFALSSMTARQHMAGSLIGMLLPVMLIVVFSDWLFQLIYS